MISAVTTNDTTTAAQSMKQDIGMDSEDFLKLFIAQLQNQDPLNPMDGTQFITQLAQMSQVEQAYNTNTNLQNILSAINGNANYSAVSFIGKEVLAPGSQVNLTNGGQPALNYSLPQSAASTEIDISDTNGNIVRTITGAGGSAGDYSVAWDGKDNSGNVLPAGTYNFSVNGMDSSGNRFTATSLIQGVVTGVKLDGTSPVLTVGGADVALSSILGVEGVN
ncbi:MAG TPA: flagellar hook capping FlgD N-terminal domain-containing protein [Geobacteraceae bacterium]|nr:flagellar hook capping FlgD N-terminal domain-containing protein [Geobacteraceae bacterium]